MKRTSFLMLFVLVFTLCMATACMPTEFNRILTLEGNKQCNALVAAVDRETAREYSSSQSMVLEGKLAVGGATMTLSGNSLYTVVYPKNGEGYRELSEASITISVMQGANTLLTQTRTQTEGYRDGKMFRATGDGEGDPVMLWSAIDSDSYRAYREELEDFVEIEPVGFLTRSCTYDEEAKQFTLTLTDIGGEELAAFYKEMIGIDDKSIYPTNLVATYIIGEDFRPISATLRFVFSNPKNTFTAESKYTYTDVESLDREISFPEANRTADLRIVGRTGKALSDLKNADKGSYEFYSLHLYDPNSNDPERYEDTRRVSFDTDGDGKLHILMNSFEKHPDLGNHRYVYEYANGKMTKTPENFIPSESVVPNEKNYTEEEARALLNEQIDYANFSICDFSAFVALDEEAGLYSLKVSNPNDPITAEWKKEQGLSQADAYYLITYIDGEVRECQYIVHFITSYPTMEVEILYRITLSDDEAA